MGPNLINIGLSEYRLKSETGIKYIKSLKLPPYVTVDNFTTSIIERWPLVGSLDYQTIPSGPTLLETGTFESRVRCSRDAGQLTRKPGRPMKAGTVSNPIGQFCGQ